MSKEVYIFLNQTIALKLTYFCRKLRIKAQNPLKTQIQYIAHSFVVLCTEIKYSVFTLTNWDH